MCQQLIGMACAGEQEVDAAFELIRKAGPMAELTRADFDDCLAFLAGDLAAPAGAFEPEPGAPPRWTSPRIWQNARPVRPAQPARGPLVPEQRGNDSLGSRRFGSWTGASLSARSKRRTPSGSSRAIDLYLTAASWNFAGWMNSSLLARPDGGEPSLPRWTSDRQSLSSELASELAGFRAEAARLLAEESATALRALVDRDVRARRAMPPRS